MVADCGVILIATFDEVQAALTQDQIAPFFQPIVELKSGQLCGFEVLARWLHPELGPILPENFIRTVEDSGFISLLTKQVLNKAFKAARIIPSSLFLAVNISPSELCSGGLAQMVRQEADEADFGLDRLILEVTESILIHDRVRALETVLELNGIGCRLSIDDFGTGHSSLSYLQEIPFYGLKIDRSFVEHIRSNRQSRKIVASVVGLSNSLHMRSVAEGVEQEEQADLLLWLGCDLAQGWLYGRPQPEDGLPNILATSYGPARWSTSVRDDGLDALPAERLALLQAIYNGVPVGLCFVDTKLRYVSMNRRYVEFTGKPRAALVGATVAQVLPDLYPIVQPLLQRALSGESITNEEISRPSSQSKLSPTKALVSYEPVRDEIGTVIGISVAILDISVREPVDHSSLPKRKNADTPAGKSQMSWMRDAKGNLKEVSSNWLALAGLTEEQALHLDCLEALHPEDRPAGVGALREAIRNRTPIDVTCRLRTSDGGYRWVRARGYPSYDDRGEFLGWYGGTEDIHEKEDLKRALQRKDEFLDSKVCANTNEENYGG